MAKESFSYPQTHKLLEHLEEAARRSAVSRGQAFEDFLEMSVCALSGGQMEAEYLAVVEKHSEGKQGKRGCDSLAAMFGEMVNQMESEPGEEFTDPLGDLFQGAITFGENSQFFSPMPICRMMAHVTFQDFEPPVDRRAKVSDPCCGSGRMLLAAAEINRHLELHGLDVDLRCVQITAINLALRNLYGYVVQGNALTLEKRKAYKTGFNLRGFIREIPVEDCPTPVRHVETAPESPETPRKLPDEPQGPSSQLELF